MRKILTSLIATLGITTVLLHSSTVATAKDKLSEYDKNVNNTIETCYLNIEDSQREYFNKEGYHIIILKEGQTPHDINSKYLEEATGLIDYNAKKIYIQYYQNEETMVNNLYHELGHMLDESKGFVSETNSFDTIWNNRTDFFSRFAYDTSYFTANKRECFAQMYAIYKMFPDWVECNYFYIYNYFLSLETGAN